MAYENQYKQLVESAEDSRNVFSTIRTIFVTEDPHQGLTLEQNRAYANLERLQCREMKDIFVFLNEYKRLAAKFERLWMGAELSDKLMHKLSPIIGPTIEKAFLDKYPGIQVGVMARITFIHDYLVEVCKQAIIQRSMKDLSFCSQVRLPMGIQTPDKKYGIQRVKTYKGKPHTTHVRVFKRKDGHKQKKCSCFICGDENHFARDCP